VKNLTNLIRACEDSLFFALFIFLVRDFSLFARAYQDSQGLAFPMGWLKFFGPRSYQDYQALTAQADGGGTPWLGNPAAPRQEVTSQSFPPMRK
jgi:hypothetical protein